MTEFGQFGKKQIPAGDDKEKDNNIRERRLSAIYRHKAKAAHMMCAAFRT